MRVFPLLLSVALVGWLTAEGVAADPIAWLPAEINAVARINVAEVYQTPLARKEGWIKKATESFIQQESFIPPGTRQILVGAELELTDNLRSLRKFSVIVPDSQFTLEKLSLWLPSGISTFSGKPSSQFGNDGYVVDVGDGNWLVSESSSRQVMSRFRQPGQGSARRVTARRQARRHALRRRSPFHRRGQHDRLGALGDQDARHLHQRIFI